MVIRSLQIPVVDDMTRQVGIITNMVMRNLYICQIRSAFMYSILRPYLVGYTEHFCHELANFKKSPYGIENYDHNVLHLIREEPFYQENVR